MFFQNVVEQMLRFINIIFLILLLTACTSSKRLHLPDGSIGHEIDCRLDPNGFNGSWADCYNLAGKICGQRGYIILDRREDHTPVSGDVYIGKEKYRFSNVIIDRLLMIKCRGELREIFKWKQL